MFIKKIFAVADRVVVTSKNNDDKQYIWESDANSFSIAEDPRGNTLLRGTQISLYLKEEARDFLEVDTIRNLVHKYSQFINFNIYLWTSKVIKYACILYYYLKYVTLTWSLLNRRKRSRNPLTMKSSQSKIRKPMKRKTLK